MNMWKIEYLQGVSIGRFKDVEADMVRINTVNGDLWFCDEKDKIGTNDYIPKFIISKGTYLSIRRVEIEQTSKQEAKEIVEIDEKMDWI